MVRGDNIDECGVKYAKPWYARELKGEWGSDDHMIQGVSSLNPAVTYVITLNTGKELSEMLFDSNL